MKPELPEAFTTRMTEVLGSRDAVDALLEAESRPALRVNPLKTTPAELERRLSALDVALSPVPWREGAYFADAPEDRSVGTLWEHQAGLAFSQDAASLLPVIALDPQPGERVLDLCAAPGGKATDIAARMQQKGLLVANEYNPGRLNHLVTNMDRFGVTNVVVTQSNGARRAWPLQFDRVLVDAPCSNLGGVHASWTPALRFSAPHARRLASIQRNILRGAFHATRPGGTIVYATCTLEPAENEGVVSWFLDKYPVEIEPVDLGVGGPGLTAVGENRFREEVTHAVRLHPGDAGTDGFFLARFRKLEDKEGGPEPKSGGAGETDLEVMPDHVLGDVVDQYGLDAPGLEGARVTSPGKRLYATTAPDLDTVLDLAPRRVGLYLGADEGRDHRLSFDAATLFGRGAGNTVELTPEDARRWLAGEDVTPAPDAWRVVTCRGEPLGAGKAFGPRMKSFVPKERRVPADGARVGFLTAGDAPGA